jgi:regulation of enolase protein 1 (concanavalin A-like superfamily)
VRLLQTTADTDFDVIAKFNSRVSGHIAMQGLIAQADDNNYVRFDISSNRTSAGIEQVRLFVGRITAGSGTSLNFSTLTNPGHPTWLRLTRSGTNWEFRYSFDGTNWTTFHTATIALTVTSVGVFAGNADPTNRYAQPFTAAIDYFHVASAPLADDPQSFTDVTPPLLAMPPHTVSGTTCAVRGFHRRTDDGAVDLRLAYRVGRDTEQSVEPVAQFQHTRLATGDDLPLHSHCHRCRRESTARNRRVPCAADRSGEQPGDRRMGRRCSDLRSAWRATALDQCDGNGERQ